MSPDFHPFSCILDTGTLSSVSRICLIPPANKNVWMKRVYRVMGLLGLYLTRHKLTNCAAFLHHQLYRTLSVLHPEVKHPWLTLYDLSGGDAGRAKCRSRWWQGWGGGGRGGGWRNSTSRCCIGCFWLAQGSKTANLVRFTGKRVG